MTAALIAPCGMNCRLCIAYVRDRNPCPGCRADDSVKRPTRWQCRIKKCDKMVERRAKYCAGCSELPCDRLKHLDKRYRAKYGMSMIENLTQIKELGVRQFIKNEKERWTCPACGELLCVHKAECLSCSRKWR
jgi:hypothetical protein